MSQIFNSIVNCIIANETNDYEITIYDQMPILYYGFIKSHPLNIYTNCKFMDLFLGEKRNKAEGNQLFQFIGICEFMRNINSNYLYNVTEEDFNKNCFIASHNGE